MPAYARKHQLRESLIYHAYNRCAAPDGGIFHSANDYRRFMLLLIRYALRFGVEIYHWALMRTHFHLLVRLEEPAAISRFMAAIAHAYTHYHHTSYGTRGFLWQGRFKLQPVQRERYLRACGRYIERNPVRAGIVDDPAAYPWSSARFYCAGRADGVTRESPAYQSFGTDAPGRQAAYGLFLGNADPEEENGFKKLEEPAGEAAFRSLLRMRDGRLMPQRQGRRIKIFEPQPLGGL